eukprot:128561_1
MGAHWNLNFLDKTKWPHVWAAVSVILFGISICLFASLFSGDDGGVPVSNALVAQIVQDKSCCVTLMETRGNAITDHVCSNHSVNSWDKYVVRDPKMGMVFVTGPPPCQALVFGTAEDKWIHLEVGYHEVPE